MNKMSVPIDKMQFSTDPNVSLNALDVSTSIVIATRGSYSADNNLISFCGLHYWSGFNVDELNPDKSAKSLLYSFFDGLRIQLDLEDDQTVLLKELHFFGGEQPHFENGELFSSGTTREVEALRKAVDAFCFDEENVVISRHNIHHDNYLTLNNQSLHLQVTLQSMHHELETIPQPMHDDKENRNDNIFAEIEDEIEAANEVKPLFFYR
jgi:hypothetical protein